MTLTLPIRTTFSLSFSECVHSREASIQKGPFKAFPLSETVDISATLHGRSLLPAGRVVGAELGRLQLEGCAMVIDPPWLIFDLAVNRKQSAATTVIVFEYSLSDQRFRLRSWLHPRQS